MELPWGLDVRRVFAPLALAIDAAGQDGDVVVDCDASGDRRVSIREFVGLADHNDTWSKLWNVIGVNDSAKMYGALFQDAGGVDTEGHLKDSDRLKMGALVRIAERAAKSVSGKVQVDAAEREQALRDFATMCWAYGSWKT